MRAVAPPGGRATNGLPKPRPRPTTWPPPADWCERPTPYEVLRALPAVEDPRTQWLRGRWG